MQRLELALDAAKSGTWEWDLRTNENIWSDELWKLYGLEPHSCQPTYEVWRRTIHPHDRAKTDQVVQEAARNGTELNAEWRVLYQDGEERWLMSRGRPLLDANGQVERFIGVVIDITERKRAEVALRESEERYQILFEGSIHGILVVDIETGRFIYANPSICRMFGYSATEFRQLGIEDIHPGDSLDHVKTEFELQRRGEKVLTGGIPCLRKDGTVFYADITAAGTIINGRECFAGFFADITERRQAEQSLAERTAQLEAANKELESFSYSVAHDLRAPLRAIDGYARMILKKQGDKFDKDILDKFNVIRSNTHMMGQLIDDLLAFSRLSRKHVSPTTLEPEYGADSQRHPPRLRR
jgi:PAS domain S-box-containing protein